MNPFAAVIWRDKPPDKLALGSEQQRQARNLITYLQTKAGIDPATLRSALFYLVTGETPSGVSQERTDVAVERFLQRLANAAMWDTFYLHKFDRDKMLAVLHPPDEN